MNEEEKNKLQAFVRHKKTTKEFQLNEQDLIYEAVQIHTHFDKENEVVLIYSTDIFPEAIKASGKTFVLFDVHYIKYMECFYSNLLFIRSELQRTGENALSDLKSIIKSDLYHFLAVRHYSHPVASLAFLKQSETHFRKISLQLELPEDGVVFFQAVNQYLIRHEIAHTFYRDPAAADAKESLKRRLSTILDLTQSGFFEKADIDLSKFGTSLQRMETKATCEALEKIIREEGIDFEELFCDFIAFQDTMFILDQLYPEANIENRYRFHIKLVEHLTIFDYLNQLFRHTTYRVECILKELKVNELSPVQLLRHSIGLPLRLLILHEGYPAEVIATVKKDDSVFDGMNSFQDIIFEYLYQTVAEINQNSPLLQFILQSDLPPEIAAKERDRILKW
ncbi:MAG: hypothetical protein NTW29_15140 [Bacteroidetes bacterium]|nr:hypothetical protein [Bacteroidota bacterium]